MVILSASKIFLMTVHLNKKITAALARPSLSKGEKVNSTELQYFKEFLLNQKSLILNKSTEFKSEAKIRGDSGCDEVEAVSNELSLNLAIHLHERDRSVLYQIEKALAKLEEGQYGVCEGCGEQIQPKRLKARPFTNLCIECAEELEDPRNYLN